MAKEQQPSSSLSASASASTGAWMKDAVPLLVVILIGAHVLGIVYWIYRLATQKQQRQRSKAH